MKAITKFRILFFALLSGVLFLSCNPKEEFQSDPIELTVTGEALSITETTALLYGYANLKEVIIDVEFGIILSTDENPSTENGRVFTTNEINSNSQYSVKATNLEPNTVYYYKSFVSNGSTIRVGTVKSFTTANYSASISTNDATEMELFSATINGTLRVESIEELDSSVWFYVSSSDSDLETLKLSGEKHTSVLGDDNTFKFNLKDLQYNTTYYYVACARVHDEDLFGEVKMFKTLNISVVVDTSNPTNITETHARLNGHYILNTTGDFDIETNFMIGKSPDTLDAIIDASGDTNSSNGDQITFYANLSNLDFNTIYYYKAVVTINGVNYYSSTDSFNTRDFCVTVSTDNIDSLSAIRAFANGSISITSIEKFSIEFGFLYSSEYSALSDLISNGNIISNERKDENGLISFEVPLYKLHYNTTYNYVAYAKIGTMIEYGDVKSFTTNDLPKGAVDMGLSVLWSKCNLGASSPEEYGDTYAWGISYPGNYSNWGDYPLSYGNTDIFSKYNDTDSKTILEEEDDAACVNLGGFWRIPTVKEWNELIDNCVWDYQSTGCEVTSKINGNTIFIPYPPGSGFVRTLWASSLTSINSTRASALEIYNRRRVSVSDTYRYSCLAIRPISF